MERVAPSQTAGYLQKWINLDCFIFMKFDKKEAVHIIEMMPDGREFLVRQKPPRFRIEIIDEVGGEHLKANLKKAAAFLFKNTQAAACKETGIHYSD